ncbi:MAG: peptide ABC transporter substrate-binding protein [Phycisphaeraceae bacterium]|nr:peptide ABC transporter substrate-binding protein [Phycisphaeraceae bacterium]
MWKLLAPSLVLLGLIAAVIAGDHPPAPAEFTYTENTSIITLDPQRISYTHDMRVSYCLYEGLLRWDNTTFIPQPAVASSWELSGDAATYTFHLRPEARWSNGEPVLASDFVFAWRRLLLPDTAADYTALFFVIDGAEDFFNWRGERLAEFAALPASERTLQAAETLWERTLERFDETVGLHAIDDHTLVVRLARPTAYFPDLVCFAIAHPVHPATVQRWASIDAATGRLNQRHDWTKPPRHVGNGPMVVTDWRFKRSFRMERSPTYWDRQSLIDRGCVASIAIVEIENPNTAVLAFETGAADWITNADRVGYLADMLEQQRQGKRNDTHAFPTFGTYFWGFNCSERLTGGRPNPFADARVRRAFALATNKQDITDKVRRLGEPPIGSLIPPGSIPGYTPPVGLGYDPAGARGLLAGAGWSDRDGDGVPENASGEPFPQVEMLCSTGSYHEDIALTLGAMWEENLGVRTRVVSKETKAYKDDLRRRDYMCSRCGWFGDYGDPLTFLELSRTGDGNNDRGYSNPAYDALLDRAISEADPDRRFEILEEAERMIVEQECPILPIFQYVQFYLYDPAVLHGVSEHPRLVQYPYLMTITRGGER